MQAAGPFLAGLDQAAAIETQPIGGARLDAAENGNPAGASGLTLRQLPRSGFLIDGWAIQGQQGHVLLLRQGLGGLTQVVGQLLGMVGKVLEEDVLLPQIALHTPAMIEPARFAGQAQAVEAGEDEENEGAKAR
jgi:hypothetical protein